MSDGQSHQDEESNKRPCVLVKLGGSAITEKDIFETVKQNTLNITTNQIQQAIHENEQQGNDSEFILIHGAGSFGHFQAHEYGVSRGGLVGDDGNTHWRKGLALTRNSVTTLHQMVLSALVRQCGLPAVGVSLFPHGNLTFLQCYQCM